ncbi:hypothetical protein ACOCG7_13790 [Paraburkholderia sp. DD10]|uniref:hypothetical protein n=1 Tax=Paraburkholderia sp. DD10 TaxID=3409691 RepID=UPI003A029263
MNRIPLRPANAAPLAPVYPWPDGRHGRSQSALFLAVDVDAGAAWTAKDPEHYKRPVTHHVVRRL